MNYIHSSTLWVPLISVLVLFYYATMVTQEFVFNILQPKDYIKKSTLVSLQCTNILSILACIWLIYKYFLILIK